MQPGSQCRPTFEEPCACWIIAGGAHHTPFSQLGSTERGKDFSAIADIERVTVDAKTIARHLQQTLSNKEVYHATNTGWGIYSD